MDPGPGSTTGSPERRVLIVDNNSDRIDDLLALVKKLGHGTETLQLDEISEKAQDPEVSPHLVIIHQPDPDDFSAGPETANLIRSHWPVPVILVENDFKTARIEPDGLTITGRASGTGLLSALEAALAVVFHSTALNAGPARHPEPAGGTSPLMTDPKTGVQDLKRSEQAWRSKAECLENLVEAFTDGVAAFDPQGNITKVNSAFAKIYGYDPKDLLRAKLNHVPDHETEKIRAVREKIKPGTSFIIETQRLTRQGRVLDIQLKTGPLSQGAGIYEIHRDITDQKRVEDENKENEAKFRTLFEQSRDAIYITSPQGIPLAFNQATMDLFGFTDPEISRIKVAELYVDPEERARNNELLEKQGYIKDCEVRLRRLDGSQIICLDTAAIWRSDNGRIKGYIGTLRDITQLRKTQEDLKKAKETAENATRAKSEFLANMSHEIRSPMNAILGLTHLALKTDLNEKQYDYLSKIKSSSNALLGIINDILDFSKIEAGRLRLESTEFNIEDVLGDLRNLTVIKAEEKGIELIFLISPKVPRGLVGDPLRLGQVLLNLTTNAIKFTTKGHVLVKIEEVEQPGEEGTDRLRLRFSVQDTGIGLNGEQIDNLFQAFTQADTSTTRKFGGTGLGLAICKNLVELMDGEICVESEPGKGSTFSFTADFGLRPEGMDYWEGSEILKDLRVLVVDDNPVAREILSESLESFSLVTGQVSSGEEAIAELENAARSGQPYQLVIMDWRMEGIDGIEASKRIKSSSELARIPSVLMVTAYGKEEVMDEARQVGIDAFLVKPVDRSLLLQTIVNLLGRSKEEERQSHKDPDHEDIQGLDQIRGAKILLAEDMEINQQVATELLTDAGFVVTVADNGARLLEILHGAPPEVDFDVILMDIQMPEMDGYTATARIRNSDSRFKDIPIIAMTAYAMSDERKKCLAAGMNDHVAKPIEPKGLFSTLVKWVGPGVREAVSPRPQARLKKGKLEIKSPLEGIAVETGLTRVAGNETLYLDLLLKFNKKHKDVNLEIGKALRLYDWETAKKLSHMIKGMAGNLGAGDLFRAAGELEAAIIRADVNALDLCLQDFTRALKQVSASIEGFFREVEKETPEMPVGREAIEMEEIRTLLSEATCLISSDYGRAIDLIDSLADKLAQTPLREDLVLVKNYLEEFNEEEALSTLEALAGKLGVFVGGVR